MNPSDVIVICALGLPIEHARDLLSWYVQADPIVVADASLHWWIHNHKDVVAAYMHKIEYRRY